MADARSEEHTRCTEDESASQAQNRNKEDLSRRIILSVTAISVFSVPLFLLAHQYGSDLWQTMFRSWGVGVSSLGAPLYIYTGLRTANRTDLACGLTLGCTGVFWLWWIISN